MSDTIKEASAPKGYYAALTGIRAIAAYMVFFHHFNPFEIHNPTSPQLPQTTTVEYARQFLEQWHIGVTIFFVLSGFLIANRYMDRIELNWRWARFYMQNRFARIYPVYFLVTAIYLICWFFGILNYKPTGNTFFFTDKVIAAILNITLLRAYFQNFLFAGNGPAWSLTVEETFYITAPFLLIGLRFNLKRLLVYPFMILGIGALLVLLCSLAPAHLFGLMANLKFMLNWTFFGRCTEFLVGIGLAYFMKKRPAPQTRSAWFTSLGLVWIVSCIIGITIAEFNLGRVMGTNTYSAIAINNFILPFGVACLFWGLIHERTLLRRMLETKLFSVLGRSSYAFYLVHGGILYLLLLRLGYTNLLLHFAVTIAVALIVFYLVEEPLQKRLHAKQPK